MFRKTSSNDFQIDSLDGLRGLALILVLLAHCYDFLPNLALIFSGAGKYGVYLFFTLSSFLLTLPLLQKQTLLKKEVWIHYFKRRFLRIYPLFAVSLVICYLFPELYIAITGVELFKMLGLLSTKGVFWSITIEFKFYFILPFLILAFRFLRNNALFCTLFILGFLALVEYVWPSESWNEWSPTLIPHLPIFALGVLGALFYLKIQQSTIPLSKYKYHFEISAIVCFAIVTLTIASVWNFVNGQTVDYRFFHSEYLLYAILWPVMMLGFLYGAGVISRFLETMPMRLLGFISYSVYIWHWFIIFFIKNYVSFLSQPVKSAITFPLIFILSYVSYLAFERPFIFKKPAIVN